jgi:two-component system nitrogen regulation sensor histidine kinase GlnL
MPIQVEVIDNGPGVPSDIRDEIFDPFVSGRDNGTGLGLALTSKIISDHNGLISLASKLGNTVFRISLPFVSKHD